MPQSPSQADKLLPGTMLAQRYRIEEHIGSGGYASVYRATDLKYGRDRAIKEVADSDPGVRRQFQLEAGLLIHSSHPNIPRGYQLLEERGRLYLVMEFVSGGDLEDRLNESLQRRRRGLDEEQVLKWAIEVCGALHEMHDREVPIIHRDIKPANIKIRPDNHPVLIDFGLAKLQTGGPTRTAAQGVSPGFAPPEQYMAKGRTDARTDIYGLGATLYACLTGKDPPEAPARLLAETGATGQALITPRDMVKDGSVSEMTDRIVVRTLELSPAARYQSAKALRDDLLIAQKQLAQRNKPASSKRAAAAPPPVLPKTSAKVPAAPRFASARPAVSMIPAAPAPVSGKGKRGMGTAAKAQPSTLAQASSKVAAAQAHRQSAAPAFAAARATAVVPAMSTAAQPAARVVGALALAPAVAAPAKQSANKPAPKAATRVKRAPTNAPSPSVAREAARPRSWLNLRGPELSSLGKFGLGLSVVETCWGIFLLMLAGVEIGMQGYAQKPYYLMALIWLGIIALVCLVGGQMLARPIYRRGRISRLRRGLQSVGLTIYSFSLHGIGIWGLLVFGTDRPNMPLAVIAFVLFAVNVFVAGVLSLANTLG